MKASLTEQIYLECSLIYRGKNDGPQRNLMCFGFGCGDGWFQIIKTLSIEVERIAQRQKDEGVEEDFLPVVSQVKQKYATLRFYVLNTRDEIEELIDNAEAETAVTCERCGNPGKVCGEDYIRVLCEACRFGKSSQ